MKEIMAIIRPKMVAPTKSALEMLGFPGMTALAVTGRGRQRGIAGEMGCEVSPALTTDTAKSAGAKYVPKRLITLVSTDEDADFIVKTIIRVNRTGQVGDGKIFVSPIDNAIRVRTSETGDEAVN
jgi:nitrogen regulatory protein PII 2